MAGILTFIILVQSPRSIWLRETEIVVNRETFDSLLAIANRPPKIVIDTIRDTIQGDIIYRDKLVPMYLDSSLAVYDDLLVSKHFVVKVLDSLQYNKIKSRTWGYIAYTDTIIKYVEKEKPVIQYKDRIEYVSPAGWYGGTSIGMYSQGFSISGNIVRQDKHGLYYGGGLGTITYYMDSKLKYYPLFELRVGKKF